jgi:Ca2+-transporting ATPase
MVSSPPVDSWEIKKHVDLATSFRGLESKEVERRVKIYGYNELQKEKPKNIFKIIFEVVTQPMFLMLLICDILYFVLGDYGEGFNIIIVINGFFLLNSCDATFFCVIYNCADNL